MTTSRAKLSLTKSAPVDVAQLSSATVAAIVDTVEDKDTVIEVSLAPKIAQALMALATDLKASQSQLAQGAIESWLGSYRRAIKGKRKQAKAQSAQPEA